MSVVKLFMLWYRSVYDQVGVGWSGVRRSRKVVMLFGGYRMDDAGRGQLLALYPSLSNAEWQQVYTRKKECDVSAL